MGILFGTILLFAMLLMWSIVLVEWIHPVNSDIEYDDCPRCAKSYQSVLESTLTLFQTVVTGDNWGLTSIPIIQKEPWTAVIVERAAEARVKDLEEKTKQRMQEAQHEKMELLMICVSIDKD